MLKPLYNCFLVLNSMCVGILPVGLSTDMVDDLRFILLVSQIEFSDSPQKVKDACPDFSLAAEIQGV